MTLTSSHAAVPQASPSVAVRVRGPVRRQVVLALARTEAGRMLRSPWLIGSAILTVVLVRAWLAPQEWNGARYGAWFYLPTGLYVATSLIVAGSFHRGRADVGVDAPVGEGLRCAARLLAAMLLVGLTVAFVAGLAVYIWSVDGFDLGYEPGRTLHAYPTLAELAQPVAVAVVAVAAGALAGRRLRHRATAALLLIAGWFPLTFTYWMFQDSSVAAFSILQSQPVYVNVGPPATDPATFPAHWLLEGPGEYQDHWARLVVSEPLAWWHNGWLVGVALLLLAGAVPSRRRLLLVGGAVVAAVSVVGQLAVYPS